VLHPGPRFCRVDEATNRPQNNAMRVTETPLGE
jgi:hypothetical protein